MTHGENIAVVDCPPQLSPIAHASVEDALREIAGQCHGVVAKAIEEQKLQRSEILRFIYDPFRGPLRNLKIGCGSWN